MSTFDYRRKLSATELRPVVAAAVGVGATVFYLGRILLQRTPLDPLGIPSPDPSSAEGQGSVAEPDKP